MQTTQPSLSQANGLRVAAGDLDRDGRDEIYAASGFGGDSRMHIFDAKLVETRSFALYDWYGAGVNVALAPRLGLPIAADSRTVKFKTRKRTKTIVARFRDSAGGAVHMTASISWGDGTSARATVLTRGTGLYDIRGTKRYNRAGRYTVIVTLTDPAGRTWVARSRAVVSRR
jgi:hypothetical protein